MNLLLAFELGFLNNLLDWPVKQNVEYSLNLPEHEQIWLHRGDKTQNFYF